MSTKPRLRLRRRWRTTLRWRQTTRRWATTPGWIFKMFLISLHTTNFCHLHLNSWGKNAIKILCKFKLCWRRMPGRGENRRWQGRRGRRWFPSRWRWRWQRRTLWCKYTTFGINYATGGVPIPVNHLWVFRAAIPRSKQTPDATRKPAK